MGKRQSSIDADDGGAAASDEEQHKNKQQRLEKVSPAKTTAAAVAKKEGSVATTAGNSANAKQQQQSLCCSGCGITESAANGALLLFDDPEEDNKEEDDQQLRQENKNGNKEEKRYCAECMTDKKVRVFWPVDQQWYIATVLKFDSSTGQHLLRYPDGDTEWVRIGEDHTTKVQYREYFNALKRAESMGGPTHDAQLLSRLPSLSNAVSFGLGQSFGMLPIEDEKTMRLKGGPSQQRQLMNQLNLNLTEMSSMSSFGLNNNGSFGMGRNGVGGGAAQQFQLFPPNFTHSFSSRHGEEGGPCAPPPLPYGSWEKQDGSRQWQQHYGGYYRHPDDDDDDDDDGVAQTPPRGRAKGRGESSTASKDGNTKKALAKAWSKIEDECLLDLVLQMKHPLKWSVIASSLSSQNLNPGVPERTGKQCRERYVNHLNPRLKTTDFTPIEDATIWRMFATVGTKWAIMSKIIPGRTDNNLKNRFHNLKRQLGREEDARSRASVPKNIHDIVHVDQIRKIPSYLTTKIEDMWDAQGHMGIIVANTVEGDGDDVRGPNEPVGEEGRHRDFFGPFIPIEDSPVQCLRCGLFAPSLQCGSEICSKTKWCKSCTKAPMHIGGNVLRECLSLRKVN